MTVEQALRNVLESLMDSELFMELEAGAMGEGVVIQGYEALGEPLPEKLEEWLNQDGDFFE